jgi:hypothetical protein
MAMNKEERLTYDIDTISDNIRKKYRALQHGIRESDEKLRKNYKPILEPLEAISRKLSGDMVVEEEDKQVIKQEEPTQHVITETESDAHGHNASYFSDDSAWNPDTSHFSDDSLANKYIRLCESSDCKRIIDRMYGVRYEAGKWMIGDSNVKIDDNDNVHVKGKIYEGTPGLYELLFMKLPKKYNKDDMRKYKSILLATNGHKQNYKYNTRINSNSGVKYRLVISKLFATSTQKKRTGSGYMEMKPNTTIDYVHWDDPNELVNRLRMLMASQSSGHTGHTNEIVSILEELREAGIIV